MSKAARLSKPFAFAAAFLFLASSIPAGAAEPVFKKNQSNLGKDIFDQSVHYEVTNLLRFDRLYRFLFRKEKRAVNINVFDEVPDSAFFTNRHSKKALSIEELSRGYRENDGPDLSGKLTISKGKFEGLNPGFFVRDSRGDQYLLKFDPPDNLEMATAAEVIGSNFYHALGYHTPQNTIVVIDPQQLVPGEGAKIIDTTGFKKDLTPERLEEFLLFIPWDADGRLRASASKILPGKNKGGIRFTGRRYDDVNDPYDHEERREFRALHVFASWLNNYDVRSHNSLEMQVKENGKPAIRRYLIDLNSALGAAAGGPKPPMFTHEHMLDAGETTKAFLALGWWEKPWQKRWREAGEEIVSPAVGYFDNRYFDPGAWKVQLPHYAFKDLTRADAFWAAKIIMSFSDEDVRAVVKSGKYSEEQDAKYIADTLIERRDMIGRHWFARANPLDGFDIEGGDLVFKDLSVKYGFDKAEGTVYHVDVLEKSANRGRLLETVQTASAELPLKDEWFSGSEGISLLIRTTRAGVETPSPYVLVDIAPDRTIAGIRHQD